MAVTAAPALLDLTELDGRLNDSEQDFWVHLKHASSIDKYPAKQHAQRVADQLDVEAGLIFLGGAVERLYRDSDQPMPFRQDRYFYYLSGCNEPGCALTYDIAADTLVLFIPPIDPKTVIWNGRSLTVDEAREQFDVDDVKLTTSLYDAILSWRRRTPLDIPFFKLHQAEIVSVPGTFDLRDLTLLDSPSAVDSVSLMPAMNACRMIKDDHEITLIKRAIHISIAAHGEIRDRLASLKTEADAHALFLQHCIAAGAPTQAYAPIVAAGINAATLHYVRNDASLAGNPFLVVDAACEYRNYAADITRAYPIPDPAGLRRRPFLFASPHAHAHAIHRLVCDMQRAAIDLIRPGTRYLDCHVRAHRVLIDGFLRLGIFRRAYTADAIYAAGTSLLFFPHGLGHHIGLEVHDVAVAEAKADGGAESEERIPVLPISPFPHSTSTTNPHLQPTSNTTAAVNIPLTSLHHPPLAAGMVLTVEPGIYFNRFALGRILEGPESPEGLGSLLGGGDDLDLDPIRRAHIDREVLRAYLHVGGVRVEDDVLVTEGGCENLSGGGVKGEGRG